MNYNYNNSYSYSRSGERLPPRATDFFDDSGPSRYQGSYSSGNQSSMDHDIHNLDRYRMGPPAIGPPLTRRSQEMDSNYPNAYRNRPQRNLESNYRGGELSLKRGYQYAPANEPLANRQLRGSYNEEPSFNRSRSYLPNEEIQFQSRCINNERPSTSEYGYDDNYQSKEENYCSPYDNEPSSSGREFESIDDLKPPGGCKNEPPPVKRRKFRGGPLSRRLGDIDEIERNRPDPRTLPWNVDDSGCPMPHSSQGHGSPRLLNKRQKDALRNAIADVALKIKRNQASYDDMPDKPIGVSIKYYRRLLNTFGLGIAQNRIYSLNNREARNKIKQIKRIAARSRPVKQKAVVKQKALHSSPQNQDVVPLKESAEEDLPDEEVKIVPPSDPNIPYFALLTPEMYPEKLFTDIEVSEISLLLVALSRRDTSMKKGLNLNAKNLNGVMYFRCTSKKQYNWVIKGLDFVNRRSAYKVKSIKSCELPNNEEMSTTISAPDIPLHTMINLLNAQNEGLDASSWIFTLEDDRKDGRRYKICMDTVSYELIKYWGFYLYYGVDRIRFKRHYDFKKKAHVQPAHSNKDSFKSLREEYSFVPLCNEEEEAVKLY